MGSIQKATKQGRAEGEKLPLLPADILRLLDILARIEIRRQTRQQLANKEKAS